MPIKVVLIASVLAQFAAALFALRLNFRYRVYSAWVLISAAAIVMAIMRATMLFEIWFDEATVESDSTVWATALSSLMVSICLLAGLSLIEPFFKTLDHAREVMERENAKMRSDLMETEAELQVARQIQADLLPTAPPPFPSLDVAALCESAEWTSGDFFDFFPLANQQTALIVADVCGHGLGPALLMSSTCASLRALGRTVDNVGQLLTLANRVIHETAASRFVTAIAIQVSEAGDPCQYASAGHPGFLLRSDGSRTILSAEVPPLGVLEEVHRDRTAKLEIAAGDVLILVTDGVLEAMSPDGDTFGHERLFDLVEAHADRSAHDLASLIRTAIFQYTGRNHLNDDVTVMIIKRTPATYLGAS